jgi:hypothetical protein
MKYAECKKIREDNTEIIGTTVSYEDIDYKVQEIIIIPPSEAGIFLIHYEKNKNAETVFMTQNNLEPMLLCINLSNQEKAIISFSY